MSCSQLCHQPAVILTWMHLQVKSLVQVVLKTLKLELGLKIISEGVSCDCHGNEVLCCGAGSWGIVERLLGDGLLAHVASYKCVVGR